MTFHVKMGTPGFLIQDGGTKMPFFTRKPLDFLANEKIKSDPGKLAFRRKGYVLIVESNRVSLPVSIKNAIKEALTTVRVYVTKFEDREKINSLSSKKDLTTSQIMLAAWVLYSYKSMIPGYLWNEIKLLLKREGN